MERALICPQCKAPLKVYWYSRSVVCNYCGTTVKLEESSISTREFRDAFAAWNSPTNYALTNWISIGDRHWAVENLIAQGENADVYNGRLARWPTELVVIKVLRDGQNAQGMEREWHTLQQLIQSEVRGADLFSRLVPQPVMTGVISGPTFPGRKVNIFRRESAFKFNFEEVRKVYPKGIPHRASLWVWRRILEALSFIHESGYVHGTVVPEHLLLQQNEHGVRLVGYGRSGLRGSPFSEICAKYEPYYTDAVKPGMPLMSHLDIKMSARCIIHALGGDPQTLALPDSVPARLAECVTKYAQLSLRTSSEISAWTIRQELGEIADDLYGAPAFVPIKMS